MLKSALQFFKSFLLAWKTFLLFSLILECLWYIATHHITLRVWHPCSKVFQLPVFPQSEEIPCKEFHHEVFQGVAFRAWSKTVKIVMSLKLLLLFMHHKLHCDAMKNRWNFHYTTLTLMSLLGKSKKIAKPCRKKTNSGTYPFTISLISTVHEDCNKILFPFERLFLKRISCYKSQWTFEEKR